MKPCTQQRTRSSMHIATVLLVGLILLGIPISPVFIGQAQSAAEFAIVLANGRVMDPESNLDAVRHIGIRAAGAMRHRSGQWL